jgi:hypothetical protein
MIKFRALPALAAAVSLTACAAQTTASSAPTSAAPATPASCHQQYKAWKTGPAKAEAKKLAGALKSVQSAGASDDLVLIESGLKRSGRIAHQLQALPMPACADPKGYWKRSLADIRASGDNAGTASGLMGLIAAEVPLKKVPPLTTKLGAEIKHTTK